MKDKIEKNFKNLNEQVEILKNKSLTINDENYTKKILLRENYLTYDIFLCYNIIKRIKRKEKSWISILFRWVRHLLRGT